MNRFKAYLVFGIILFTGSVNAIEADVQSVDFVAPTTTELQAFEELMQDALGTTKPSVVARAGVGVTRELAKVIGTVVVPFLLVLQAKKCNNQAAKLGILAIGAAFLYLSSPISESIYKRDQSLVALQKLQKYITSLKPDQKYDIKAIFKEKYVELLNKKILQEKDGKGLVIGRSVVGIIDALILPILLVTAIESVFKNKDDMIMWLGKIPAVISALSAIYTTWYSTDRQKSLTLQQIEAALK